MKSHSSPSLSGSERELNLLILQLKRKRDTKWSQICKLRKPFFLLVSLKKKSSERSLRKLRKKKKKYLTPPQKNSAESPLKILLMQLKLIFPGNSVSPNFWSYMERKIVTGKNVRDLDVENRPPKIGKKNRKFRGLTIFKQFSLYKMA